MRAPPFIVAATLGAAAVCFAAGGLAAAGVGAAGADDAVDALVHAGLARQHIPGAALLVARDGHIVRARGYGLANVELGVPVRPDTIFQSGSIGKQFTATAVMMLAREGKLRLDEPVARYFPGAPADWERVTVRDLLCHMGGFGDYPEGFDMRRDYTEAELLDRVQHLPLAFAPGTGWTYSNLGYLTLGVLIHNVTGEFYGDFLAARIFAPLGMRTTRIISESDIVPNRAAGYRLVDGRLANQEWVSPTLNTTADGALYFSILDLAHWDAALYGDRILPQETLASMWRVCTLRDGQPNDGHYGYGWFVDVKHDQRIVEHTGSWQGFEGYIGRYLDAHLTVAILTNLGDADSKAIADGVAALYLDGRVH